MTKFSEIVKFINTNHPDRREGLLKADLKDSATFHFDKKISLTVIEVIITFSMVK